jgi:hypothetical protein
MTQEHFGGTVACAAWLSLSKSNAIFALQAAMRVSRRPVTFWTLILSARGHPAYFSFGRAIAQKLPGSVGACGRQGFRLMEHHHRSELVEDAAAEGERDVEMSEGLVGNRGS